MKQFILMIILIIGMGAISLSYASGCTSKEFSVNQSEKINSWTDYCNKNATCGSSGSITIVPTPTLNGEYWQVTCKCCK
jgi:hypothetical protein